LLDENDDRPCCPGLWSFDFGSSFSRHWSRWRRDRTNGSIFGTPELSRVETSDIFCTFRALGEVPCACHQFFSMHCCMWLTLHTTMVKILLSVPSVPNYNSFDFFLNLTSYCLIQKMRKISYILLWFTLLMKVLK
jgi:hypothetical protein